MAWSCYCLADDTSTETVSRESGLPSSEPLCKDTWVSLQYGGGRRKRFPKGVFLSENKICRSLKESTSELNSRTFHSFFCQNSSQDQLRSKEKESRYPFLMGERGSVVTSQKNTSISYWLLYITGEIISFLINCNRTIDVPQGENQDKTLDPWFQIHNETSQ